ncbi:hypothetical protein AGMMS50268_27230 [Spirochaetia bacterium]|nr:hypothetical protein AGMMS50268_27230 [Spirochaetia bacterium]
MGIYPVNVAIFTEGVIKRRIFGVIVLMTAAALVFAGGKSDSAAGRTKPAEITVEVFDRGTGGDRSSPVSNNWTKWIQEKLLKDENIKVTFVPVPRQEETTVLNTMMTAGNAPDICLTYDTTFIANYRNQDGLYDLSPHVERLMPDLKKFLGPDPSIPGSDLIYRYRSGQTGRMYSIPARRTNTANYSTFIRKDWLDKLGLPLPKTRDEFYRVLVAFRDKDPGGVGKDQVVPFSWSPQWGPVNSMNSFIDPDISSRDIWINYVIPDSGASWPTMPGIKEGYRWLNKLYNEGLIDPYFPLRNSGDWDKLQKSGLTGSFEAFYDHPYVNTPGIQKDLQAGIPGAEFVAIDCFTNAKGITSKLAFDVEGVHFFIPSYSKNPEAAMRYVNWLARFENMYFLQFGPEGITHDMVDGIPQVKTVTGPWIQNSVLNLDYTIPVNGLYLGSDEKNKAAIVRRFTIRPDLAESAYKAAMTNTWSIPVVPADLSVGGPYQQTLKDKLKNFSTLAITGKPVDFDRLWDQGLADWLASGAQAIIDERAAKYAAP